jgi:hypothetical protein
MTDQFCNATGSCQTKIGCTTSYDCPAGEFCDTKSGNCTDNAQCTEDVQCQLGQICDTTVYMCVAGCNEAGDCPLGDVCECPNNQTNCPRKQCVNGPCLDDSYCQFGQLCEGPDGGPLSCVNDTRGPFCQPCTVSPGATTGYCPNSDGTPNANFCLLDATSSFGADFCGVDCSEPGQTCPWGFECDDILVLTEATCGKGLNNCPLRTPPECTTNADCGGHGTCDTSTNQCRCASNSDCPAGTCDMASGECRGVCQFPTEGAVEGYCTCVYDTDCPANTCTSSGVCSQTLKPCSPSDPNSCTPVFCKTSTDPLSGVTEGYCFVGRNCAPEDGVACSQVLSIQGQ